ncbi:glyoxylate/hydroxypyruvate reductase A [Pseudorhizobium tarimense]|uniref:Glyoxylate/hydroxypyruvate reductase A n=1 Tax=Pseudorhizobium tarimense TaxID=1079109 RepID=A0ABV2H1S3_9HYPH|nr:glyoxylate/hydroxypyruvate reductase A [Pseudorhizobium tarimense]MCJ8517884.1 glyoxylate/hydroxypyruvate reductase A [Pseudorhizobium tarimense]
MPSSPGAVVVDLKFERREIEAALEKAFPGRAVLQAADKDQDLSHAAYLVAWKPDPNLFRRAPNLKVLFSGGAGVDHFLAMPDLPDLPIVRFVDESLTTRMSEWVVLQCLSHLRQMPVYLKQQRNHHWRELAQPEAKDVTVGIMGLGVLGRDAAVKLKMMGFNVLGWSRTRKDLDGIRTFDASGLPDFLGECDILVGLLPLTDDTRGIFDRHVFASLRQEGALGGPVFVNAGRGGSQVEADLLAALQDGTLRGASLDVFSVEPLPEGSSFWGMENVVITPHAASASDVRALFRHVERQIGHFEDGKRLEHLVDRKAGY